MGECFFMATIQERSKNSYRITVSCGCDSDGKQIRKTKTVKFPEEMSKAKQKKEAEKQAIQFEQEVQNGTYLDGEKITFGDLAQRWITEYAEKELAPMTVSRYKQLLNRINLALGNLKLCKIQPLHIIQFMNNLAEGGIREDNKFYLKEEHFPFVKERKKELYGVVNERTVASILKSKSTNEKTAHKIANFFDMNLSALFVIHNTKEKLSEQTLLHHFRLLKAILNTAVRWNLLVSNPAERVKPPRVEKKEISCLNGDEINRMLELLKTEPLKYQAAVYIGVFGGLRVGEVTALKWSDIDFQTGKISVTKAAQYISGMGNFEKTPKNDSSKRELILPDIALQILKEHQREQAMERLALGSQWISGDYIFTQWNGKRISYSTISHWFIKWISKTDLPKVTFHGLRHSNASVLIAHGTNIATVSKRLGHSRISTTSDIYTHAIGKMDHEAANTLDAIFAPKLKISQA